ncbi:Uncharacterised protein [Bacillus freudenreichii]|nr:Uncharacterised protein [Bacillus freudenreichii]
MRMLSTRRMNKYRNNLMKKNDISKKKREKVQKVIPEYSSKLIKGNNSLNSLFIKA